MREVAGIRPFQLIGPDVRHAEASGSHRLISAGPGIGVNRSETKSLTFIDQGGP